MQRFAYFYLGRIFLRI